MKDFVLTVSYTRVVIHTFLKFILDILSLYHMSPLNVTFVTFINQNDSFNIVVGVVRRVMLYT